MAVMSMEGVTTLNEHGDAKKELATMKIIDGDKQFAGLVTAE